MGHTEEGEKLGKINRIIAVVVLRLPLLVFRLTHQRFNDERLQALFACDCRHVYSLLKAEYLSGLRLFGGNRLATNLPRLCRLLCGKASPFRSQSYSNST